MTSHDVATNSHHSTCLVASHNHVRKSVGIFDVGHMVQSKYAAAILMLGKDTLLYL